MTKSVEESEMDDQDYVVDAMPAVKEDTNLLADGSKDYRGRIAMRNKTGGWKTAPLVFGPETCEKMAVVGIVINIVPYLTHGLHLSSSYSANLVTTYQGTSYILTLLGGFIADAFLGRYWVIVGSAIVQFLGLLLITLSAALSIFKPKPCQNTEDFVCPAQNGTPLLVIYVSVYLIAIGTGGIKACASAFGADQFDPNHPKEKKNLAGFFSWYFFGISCGGVFAVTVLVWIQDNVGRTWGYFIPTLTMLLVVISFLSGRSLYRYKAPKGSPLTQILQVFVAAYKNRKLNLPQTDLLFELDEKEQPYDYMRVKRSSQFKFLDKAAIIDQSSRLDSPGLWWQLNTVTRVEETKMVIRLIPILITTSLFYTVYAQMTTFSVEQGSTMQRRIGNSFQIPAASMAAFLQASILLSLYLWEKLVVPIARRFTGIEKGTTSLQRIGIGLVISVFAMIIAAVVEKKRMNSVHSQQLGFQLLEKDNAHAHVSMSIFWLLPQYILVGAGEALTYAGQLDFFYNESPKGMRSMGSALCICTLSLGYYTSSLLVSVVNSVTGHKRSDGSIHGAWLPNDINTGKLYNFYWLLAIASLGNFILYLACAHWYQYKAVAGDESEDTSVHGDSNHKDFQDIDLRDDKDHIKIPNDFAKFPIIKPILNGESDYQRETQPNVDFRVKSEDPEAGHRLQELAHHRRQRSRARSFPESPEADFYLTMRNSP